MKRRKKLKLRWAIIFLPMYGHQFIDFTVNITYLSCNLALDQLMLNLIVKSRISCAYEHLDLSTEIS